MAKQLLNGLDAYYEKINKAIICKAEVKKDFIQDLKERIGDFSEENPAAGIDDIIAHFGQPEEIAKTFFENLDPVYIKKAINWKRIMVIGVIIAIALLSVYLIISFIDGHSSVNGYAVTSVIVEATTSSPNVTFS